MRYYLFPFWSYDVFNYKVIAQHILNVLMFVPIGFLLGATVIKIGFWQLIKIGCMMSVAIEIIQLFSHRGVCNIDDVIHNTFGCAIGYGAFLLCNTILKIKHT
jgi:glycopeptide antibiotics resistance protein